MALTACPQRTPYSMLLNQLRWPEPPALGKLHHFDHFADDFPLHTAGVVCRRNLLALCAALLDARSIVADSLFSGQADQFLRNFAERIGSDMERKVHRWSKSFVGAIASVGQRAEQNAYYRETAQRIARLKRAVAAGRAITAIAADGHGIGSGSAARPPLWGRSPALL